MSDWGSGLRKCNEKFSARSPSARVMAGSLPFLTHPPHSSGDHGSRGPRALRGLSRRRRWDGALLLSGQKRGVHGWERLSSRGRG